MPKVTSKQRYTKVQHQISCRGPGWLWGRLRHELVDSQLHGSGLHRCRVGEPQRGLLLHGECSWPPHGNAAIWSSLSIWGNTGLPVDVIGSDWIGFCS